MNKAQLLATISSSGKSSGKRNLINLKKALRVPQAMNCAVIIPAHNESRHIAQVVKGVLAQECTAIVVDDGSADQTSELARLAGATVLRHIINLGKGAAANTGCEYALKKSFETLILMDGDGQHRPEDIPILLKALKKTSIVFGYRVYDHKMPPVMRFGNWFINLSSSIINGVTLRDTQSGLRAMKTSVYQHLRWESSDYGMESEMIARMVKHKISCKEVPIPNIYEESYKGTSIFDGIKIVLMMLKWRIFA